MSDHLETSTEDATNNDLDFELDNRSEVSEKFVINDEKRNILRPNTIDNFFLISKIIYYFYLARVILV